MPRDLLSFRAGRSRTSNTLPIQPDPAFAALDLFRRLVATLEAARAFRDACHAIERRTNRWGVPPTFFLADSPQGERQPTRPPQPTERHALAAAKRLPYSASAWTGLHELLDNAFTGCAADPQIRHTARATPKLLTLLNEFAPDHPGCAEFHDLLNVADDLPVTVLHPQARTGFRILLNGIATLDQLHLLLADQLTGSPARGFLPGQRPDPGAVDAYLDQPATNEHPIIATARFQLYHPDVLREHPAMPQAFAGNRHWLWGHESPRTLPRIANEAVLVIGEAVYARQWIARRRFSALNGKVDLLHVLTNEQVENWLNRLTGRTDEPATVRRAA